MSKNLNDKEDDIIKEVKEFHFDEIATVVENNENNKTKSIDCETDIKFNRVNNIAVKFFLKLKDLHLSDEVTVEIDTEYGTSDSYLIFIEGEISKTKSKELEELKELIERTKLEDNFNSIIIEITQTESETGIIGNADIKNNNISSASSTKQLVSTIRNRNTALSIINDFKYNNKEQISELLLFCYTSIITKTLNEDNLHKDEVLTKLFINIKDEDYSDKRVCSFYKKLNLEVVDVISNSPYNINTNVHAVFKKIEIIKELEDLCCVCNKDLDNRIECCVDSSKSAIDDINKCKENISLYDDCVFVCFICYLNKKKNYCFCVNCFNNITIDKKDSSEDKDKTVDNNHEHPLLLIQNYSKLKEIMKNPLYYEKYNDIKDDINAISTINASQADTSNKKNHFLSFNPLLCLTNINKNSSINYSNNKVFKNYFCDNCSSQITNIRYSCANCYKANSFDLCEKCYNLSLVNNKLYKEYEDSGMVESDIELLLKDTKICVNGEHDFNTHIITIVPYYLTLEENKFDKISLA